MKLTSEKIGAVSIDIEVSNSGVFTAEFDDESFSGKTIEELREKLTRAVRKAADKKAVDVTVINIQERKPDRWGNSEKDPYEEGVGIVHAKLRGRHSRQGAWLLVDESAKKRKFQVSTYSREGQVICRRLTPEEIAEYERVTMALADAEAAANEFRDRVKVDAAELLGES